MNITEICDFRKDKNMPDCIIAMKTRTAAEYAKRTAASAKINTSVVSVDPSVTRHGCAFGLRLSCDNIDKLTNILDKRNISYGDIIGRQ